jgi:hypothetical protein
MNRPLILVSLLLMAGCQVCKPSSFTRPASTGDPWNTTYLIDLDPTSRTIADLASHIQVLDQHYWDYAQVNGVLWPPQRSDESLAQPDRWVNGGDSGIYSGTALAAFAFRYKAEGTALALDRVKSALRGVYILTHGSGTPGVIQRNSFPSSQPDKFGYPGEWGSRIARGFVHSGPALVDPFGGPPIPAQTYYTRGTKDQLTGMVFGLATTWALVDPATVPASQQVEATAIRGVVTQITRDVYNHLLRYEWRIRDEHGENETSADYVSNLLRATLLGLVVKTGVAQVQAEYDKEFDQFIDLSNTLAYADRFANFNQYYAHNLRASRALSIWLLEGATSIKGTQMASYIQSNIWKFTKGHKSGWFAFARAATAPSDAAAIAEGVFSLKSLSLKPIRMWSSPYHGQEQKPDIVSSLICARHYVLDPHLRKPEDYSTWQKEPWDTGSGVEWDKKGRGDASGLDYLLAYWLGKAYGLF